MEDQTQAVGDEGSRLDDDGSDIAPVGYLRVSSQKDLEQTDYPIREGIAIVNYAMIRNWKPEQ